MILNNGVKSKDNSFGPCTGTFSLELHSFSDMISLEFGSAISEKYVVIYYTL